MQKYDIQLKAMVTYEICEEGKSTSITAQKYGVPLKTVENWVTKYNKNKNVFKIPMLSESEQIKELQKENLRLKRDNEILKKKM